MKKLITIMLAFCFATELAAVPVPDVVLYGRAWLDSVPVSAGNIMGTVGGRNFYASFASEAGVDYYILRIPADNSIGGSPRWGTILIDDPNTAARTLNIEIEGTPIHQGPIILGEGGIRRMDIAAYKSSIPKCGDPIHQFPGGDLSQDCWVDMLDFAILGNDWISGFNLVDLAEIADNWLKCTHPYACFKRIVFAEGFESGSFDYWEFEYSTNGQQSGSISAGSWKSEIVSEALEGLYSGRLFAQSTGSYDPWQVVAGISATTGKSHHLLAKLKFDDIQGSGGVGISYFEVAVLDAQDTSQVVTYRFSTTGDVWGDYQIVVNPGDELDLGADFGQAFLDKYGTEIPGDIIIRFRSVADYAEGGSGIRTTDVRLDGIEVR